MSAHPPRLFSQYREIKFTGAVQVARDGTLHGALEVRQNADDGIVYVTGGSVHALTASLARARATPPVRVGAFSVSVNESGHLQISADDDNAPVMLNGVVGPLRGLRFSRSVRATRPSDVGGARVYRLNGGPLKNICCRGDARVEIDSAMLDARLDIAMFNYSVFTLPAARFTSLALTMIGQCIFNSKGALVDELSAKTHGSSMLSDLTVGGACTIKAADDSRVAVCALDQARIHDVVSSGNATIDTWCPDKSNFTASYRQSNSKRAPPSRDDDEYDDTPVVHIENLDGLAVGDDAADIIAAAPEPPEKRARSTNEN
jgi:hypothetical protein